jgi:choline dehydrogenase
MDRSHQTIEPYDYVIVGAGSAGCVLANRLSADRRNRVLLVEAGPEDKSPLIHMPKGFGALIHDPKHAWRFEAQPHAGNNFRTETWARGKMLGGSSSINGMTYVRGQREDYDGWATDLGLTGWGWREMGAAFRAIEDHALGDDGVRGVGGALHISPHPDRHPVSDAIIAAAKCIGVPHNDDQNRPEQFALGYMCRTIKDGRRQSAAVAFLNPARARPNLRIVTDSIVHRVLFESNRAIGIQCGPTATPRVATDTYRAARGVIICAGALQSPQILQLSGIGPAQHLRAHQVPVIVDLPGVGRNLREHWAIWMNYRMRRPLSDNRQFSGPRLVKNLLRYALTRKGVMASSSHELNGFLKTRPDLDRADLQIHAAPYSLDLSTVASKPRFERDHGANVLVYPTRPESSGTIMIRSASVADTPLINPRYLDTDNDRRTAIDAVRLIRRLVSQEPLRPYLAEETSPGTQVTTDEEILDAWRRLGQSGYHAVGTCKMGLDNDPNAVVDACLRVRGVEALRVVDCSVMPTPISGNTNAPAMATAWRAADLILRDTP